LKGNKMKTAGILSIQFNPKPGDKEYNLAKIEDYILKNSSKKLDLVLFPEFFSTGIDANSFVNFPEDESGGETIQKISQLAKKYNTNIIAGSVIEKSKEKLYNTSFALDRNGNTLAKYRKMHLFNYNGGREGEIITPGDKFVVVEFDFAKVGMNVCYDIRYPMLQKTLSKMGAEILVLPTAWCVPTDKYNNKTELEYEQNLWQALKRIRAYDNLCYLVSSNQTGVVDKKLANIGYSLVVSPEGKILANAKNDECAIYSEIDLDIVRKYKKEYPISDID